MHKTKTDRVFSFIKNAFLVLIFLQFIPGLVDGTRHYIDGLIFPKIKVGYLCLDGSINDATKYVKKLDKFFKDDDIQGLLIKINSPGGVSGSCQFLFNELKRFAAKKPIVAVIENIGASGAYYAASAAHTIVASPLALVGSIGVFMQIPQVKGLLDDWKVNFATVTTGKYKAAGNPLKNITDDEFDYFQKLSDSQYSIFVQDVAAARKLDIKTASRWAEGQIFSGRDALALGLVDKEGSLYNALDELKKLLKTEDELQLVGLPGQRLGLLQSFFSDDDFADGVSSAADIIAHTACSTVEKIRLAQNSISSQL